MTDDSDTSEALSAGVIGTERVPGRSSGVVLVWLVVGALVGGTGAVLVQTGPWWAAVLVHYAVPYVLLITVIGATAPRMRAAAIRAVASFVPFVLAYYAGPAVRYGSIPVLYASAWLLAALTVCPIAAVAVRWAVDRRGVAAAAVFATAGAAALSDGAVGNLVRVAIGRLDPGELPSVLWVTGPVDLVVALGIVLLAPRQRQTRLLATALLVPLSVIGTWVGWALHFGVGPYR